MTINLEPFFLLLKYHIKWKEGRGKNPGYKRYDFAFDARASLWAQRFVNLITEIVLK